MAELNEYVTEEYLEQARSRVTEQFKGKVVFDKYLDLMLRGALELEIELGKLQQLRSIDTAQGAQLDILGEIVGQPRTGLADGLIKYFGFQEGANPSSLDLRFDTQYFRVEDGVEGNAGPFGSSSDGSIGAPWYTQGAALTGVRLPNDEEYRLLIKAKILKNRTMATPEDIIAAYKFLFGTGVISINEGPASVTLGIGKILTAVERGLLFGLQGAPSLLPKTIGVKYDYVEFNTQVFALAGYPDAYGVGDLDAPGVGGFLSNLL